LTLRQADIGFLPVGLTADAMAGTLALTLDIGDAHVFHLDSKQLLHGGLDFTLVGVAGHLEHDLIAFLGNDGRFFRDMRCHQHLEDALFVHASISSTFLSAGTVTSTFSNPIKLTGSTPNASLTSTLCKLREER